MTEYMRCIIAWVPTGLDWIIILIVALLFFGRRLPEIARSLGRSLTEFRKGINEAQETKDQIKADVRKIKEDVEKETRDAAGLNDTDKKD